MIRERKSNSVPPIAMTKKLAIIALFATCGLHGAIKKADPKPPEQPAQKSPDKTADDTLMEELLKHAPRDGGQRRMNAPEFSELLRGMLEKQGVPKEQLRNANLIQLLKLLQEKNAKVIIPNKPTRMLILFLFMV